jgi:hypothetical protein
VQVRSQMRGPLTISRRLGFSGWSHNRSRPNEYHSDLRRPHHCSHRRLSPHAPGFAALDPYGLAYLGGRVGQVGMGGFTLGGGTSVLSAKHGWALDSVLEYEASAAPIRMYLSLLTG